MIDVKERWKPFISPTPKVKGRWSLPSIHPSMLIHIYIYIHIYIAVLTLYIHILYRSVSAKFINKKINFPYYTNFLIIFFGIELRHSMDIYNLFAVHKIRIIFTADSRCRFRSTSDVCTDRTEPS